MADNGVLSLIPGDVVAKGSSKLPPAGPESAAEHQVETFEAELGFVRITYQLNSYTHGRSRRWHWLAVYAEKVA